MLRALAASAVTLLFLLTACGGSSAAVSGLPANFPTYGGAHLDTSTFAANRLDATWTTGDGTDKVAAFYKTELDKDDWKILDSAGNAYDFQRKSDKTYGGTVYITKSGSKTSIHVKMGKGCPC